MKLIPKAYANSPGISDCPRRYNHGSKFMIAAADEGKTSLAME